jgi:hypothetical protein
MATTFGRTVAHVVISSVSGIDDRIESHSSNEELLVREMHTRCYQMDVWVTNPEKRRLDEKDNRREKTKDDLIRLLWAQIHRQPPKEVLTKSTGLVFVVV